MTCSASSSRPGFSYLVGVNDRDMRRFRNFCDCGSAGAAGSLGRCLSDAYDGGVDELLDIAGRWPGDDKGWDADDLRLEAEERSRGEDEALRALSSFSRFVRRRPSNCTRRSLAHCSSYCWLAGASPPLWSPMMGGCTGVLEDDGGARLPRVRFSRSGRLVVGVFWMADGRAGDVLSAVSRLELRGSGMGRGRGEKVMM